jgi:hypothetical protein
MRESSTIRSNPLPASDEWQLGAEPEGHEVAPRSEPQPPKDLSTARLTRPVHMITVEQLAWSAVAAWMLMTRVLELGTAPLGPAEARHALFEYDLVNGTSWASAVGYHPSWAGWVHLLQAGIFAAIGVSDAAARVTFVAAGLLLVAMVFLMRHRIGRAGAIAVGALITISPTFTYFSRASALSIVMAALAMFVISAFMELTGKPSLLRATGVGCASGLLCAGGAAGLATATSLFAGLALLGLYRLVGSKRVYLNLRIWLIRYGGTLLAAIVVAALCWWGTQIGLSSFAAIARNAEKVWRGFSWRDYLAGVRYYAPGILLYEFLIILTAVAGLVAIFLAPAWSNLKLFSLFWLAFGLAYFLGSNQRESERLVLILLPLVMVGGLGVDYLHHTQAWPYARLMLLALGAATVYVQVLSNFIYVAPTANEPPRLRHANLYWRDGATTIEARPYLNSIRRRFPEPGGTVYSNGEWQPALRWYLRDFRPANSAKVADLVINPNPPAFVVQDPDFEDTSKIDLDKTWDPALSTLTAARAIRFVLAAHPWTPLRDDTIAIMIRPPTELAPTLIIPPSFDGE